jgi:hypothetical protein
MKDFYYSRWKILIDQTRQCLKTGTEFNQEDFNSKVVDFEVNWTKQNNTYNTKPVGNSVTEAKRIYDKYFAATSKD